MHISRDANPVSGYTTLATTSFVQCISQLLSYLHALALAQRSYIGLAEEVQLSGVISDCKSIMRQAVMIIAGAEANKHRHEQRATTVRRLRVWTNHFSANVRSYHYYLKMSSDRLVDGPQNLRGPHRSNLDITLRLSVHRANARQISSSTTSSIESRN